MGHLTTGEMLLRSGFSATGVALSSYSISKILMVTNVHLRLDPSKYQISTKGRKDHYRLFRGRLKCPRVKVLKGQPGGQVSWILNIE